jgi:hypothetical protein
VKDFRKVKVWEKSHQLTLEVNTTSIDATISSPSLWEGVRGRVHSRTTQYECLANEIIQVKQMLAAFIRKLRASR